MDDKNKEETIRAYFTAIDQEALNPVRERVSENIEFLGTGGHIQGIKEFKRYVEGDRPITSTTHNLSRITHPSEGTSYCEGEVQAESSGEEIHGAFCDVFEFGQDDKLLKVSVYTRL